MINENELRLGNYFIERETQEVIRVIELRKDQIMFSGKFDQGWQAEPIPLNEEWLVKFGFDDLGAYGWGIGYFHIRFRNLHKFYFPLENRIIRVKHVHQLQNLYFALTGEELTIK
jgi:hypothetical protein